MKKIRKLNKNKHKAVIIPDRIFQTNKKLFVMVNRRYACKLEFDNHLLLTFLYQPQSDVVVFAIIYFRIHKNLVKEQKNGISTNDIIKSNEKMENVST